jgi:hypothetical protein
MRAWNAIGLFCEDVRENGRSIIGIMPDHMEVNVIPGALPKIGIYIRVHLDPTDDVKSITAAIKFPDGNTSALGGFNTEQIQQTQRDTIAKGTPWAGFIITAVAAPFPIASVGRLLLIVKVDDQEMVCGSLNVIIPTPAP